MPNDSYHYPPELLALLVDTIPLLCRSKRDVLTFFRGSGVPDTMTADLQQRLAADRGSVNKYEIARTVLTRLNERGDGALAQRREVIRRVTEYEDFSTAWPDDQLKAKGLVAEIRRVVHVKDSFTRMQQEQARERLERLKEKQQAATAVQGRREQHETIRRRLASLRSMTNPQQRGKAFEGVLNDLFAIDGLSVRDAFTINGEDGHVVEQIDGLIELDGQPYLVEAKWLKDPVDISDVSRHLVRVFNRTGVYGLMISASGYTDPAVEECRRSLTRLVMILAETNELLLLLERSGDLSAWLKAKLRAATVDRNPLHRPDIS
ncbi:MAG TPA: restriction endonuclease [Streptosporangiaceae bacterium]|nr:restriction endonuclease [Streptosporangiaceae bacterium]